MAPLDSPKTAPEAPPRAAIGRSQHQPAPNLLQFFRVSPGSMAFLLQLTNRARPDSYLNVENAPWRILSSSIALPFCQSLWQNTDASSIERYPGIIIPFLVAPSCDLCCGLSLCNVYHSARNFFHNACSQL